MLTMLTCRVLDQVLQLRGLAGSSGPSHVTTFGSQESSSWTATTVASFSGSRGCMAVAKLAVPLALMKI
jgi:hypothetical protein